MSDRGAEHFVNPVEVPVALKMAYLTQYLRGQQMLTEADVPDEYTLQFNIAFADAIDEYPEVRSFIAGTFEQFPGLSPRHFALRSHNALKALDMVWDPQLYNGREDPREWHPTLRRLVSNTSFGNAFRLNVAMPVVSNVPERAKVLKLVALWHGLPQPLGIGDFGCSANSNIMQLMLEQEDGMQFDPVSVVARREGSYEEKDIISTLGVNYLLQEARLRLGHSTGYDLFNIDRDQIFADRVWSDSFRWKEHQNQERVARFTRLMNTRHPLVHTQVEDITTFKAAAHGIKHDLVSLQYVLWQLDEKEVADTLANAEEAAGDDGLVVVQDTIIFTDGGTQPKVLDSRKQWNASVWVKDMREADRGYRHELQVKDGRVGAIMIQKAVGELSAAREIGIIPQAA